jgi:streptomycin 6-kinase
MKKNVLDNLPTQFTENVLGVCGTRGRRWLNDLPEIVGEIAEKWALVVENPFPNLSYNYVAPCISRADGSGVVLKIGLPEENDSVIFGEAEFLKITGGSGAVKLLQFDADYRALLLERLLPGENLVKLAETDDEQATTDAIRVLNKICRPPPADHAFPTLDEWVGSFLRAGKTNFDFARVKKAQRIFERLIGSSRQSLLHGDLHHQNILSAQRGQFLAIDPKGIVGDIGFEISVFLNNPRGWILSVPDRRKMLCRRVEQFAEAFTIEPRDLRDWAFAEAVLSAWWTIEDGGSDWEKWLACAAIWELKTV